MVYNGVPTRPTNILSPLTATRLGGRVCTLSLLDNYMLSVAILSHYRSDEAIVHNLYRLQPVSELLPPWTSMFLDHTSGP